MNKSDLTFKEFCELIDQNEDMGNFLVVNDELCTFSFVYPSVSDNFSIEKSDNLVLHIDTLARRDTYNIMNYNYNYTDTSKWSTRSIEKVDGENAYMGTFCKHNEYGRPVVTVILKFYFVKRV